MRAAAVLDRTERSFGVRRKQDRLRSVEVRPDDGAGRAPLFEINASRARTLDELITDTWEGLTVRGTARCPACQGQMSTRTDAHSEVGGGECMDCGASLC
jgi:hypothetical protein